MLHQIITASTPYIKSLIKVANATDTHHIQCSALWDTGASCCAISPQIVKDLELPHICDRIVSGIGTSGKQTRFFLLNFELEDGTRFMTLAAEEPSLTHCHCILGMDIIRQGDWLLKYDENKYTFSFNVNHPKYGIEL